MLATLLGGVWLAIGLAYHWVGGRRAAGGLAPASSGAEVRDILATSEDHVELERYRVFLPLREFEDEALVELGARIARAKNAELSLLHVVEIPRNLPPKAIRFRYVDDRIRGLQRLARIGEHPFPRPRGSRLAEMIAGKALFFGWALVVPALYHRWWVVLVFYAATSFMVTSAWNWMPHAELSRR